MEFLQRYLTAFNQYIEDNRFNKEPHSLYEPIDYLMSIGGKRIRPALALMSYDLFQNDIEKALPIAMSVEVFHNFSLMHDDIMDDATLRRGKECVHIKYNTNTAILSGDMMLIKAYEYLQHYEPLTFAQAFTIFNKMAIEVCEGQAMDMDFEVRNNVTIPEYLQMITYKTSVLIAASLQLGALVAGASKEDQEHIYEFGKNIGIAFQIQDDYLDTFGTPDLVGKKVGGDIIQNKKTYLYLKSIELSSEENKSRLAELYSSTPEDEDAKVEEVKKIFKSAVADEYAKMVMEAYQQLAVSHVNSMNVDETKKKSLIEFAKFLVGRDH